jgi:hypothetical protein
MISIMLPGRFVARAFTPAAVLAVGCTNPFASAWKEAVAHVVEWEAGDFLQVPAEAAVGAEVKIQIRSSGTPDCDRISRTHSQWDSPTSLMITPYNESKVGRATCNYSAKFFYHSATVRFSKSGSYDVRLRARSGQRGEVSVIASRTVLVR